jgi:hypothetical protein
LVLFQEAIFAQLDWDKLNIQNKRISISFQRVLFCETISPVGDESLWTGSALYKTRSDLQLSDRVDTETRINDQPLELKWGTSGISYKDEQKRELIGHFIDDKQLKVYWKLPKDSWSKAQAWEWAIAAQDVLSIWFGETVWLLRREFSRASQKIIEINQTPNSNALGLLSPFRDQQFDKQAFVKLTDFFVRDPSKAEVCRKIFWQLVEASNQRSSQAQELLLSTILEASLRTIENRPFKAKKDKSWNVGKGLTNFFNTYLPSAEWANIQSQVMKEHCYLRDRNAHPDWLFSQSGSLSEAEQAKSLDSMLFLSRFYGYMILALAGFNGLEPNFPPSHRTWNAAATITVVSDANSETAFPDFLEPGGMSDVVELANQLSEARTYHDKKMILRNFQRRTR